MQIIGYYVVGHGQEERELAVKRSLEEQLKPRAAGIASRRGSGSVLRRSGDSRQFCESISD